VLDGTIVESQILLGLPGPPNPCAEGSTATTLHAPATGECATSSQLSAPVASIARWPRVLPTGMIEMVDEGRRPDSRKRFGPPEKSVAGRNATDDLQCDQIIVLVGLNVWFTLRSSTSSAPRLGDEKNPFTAGRNAKSLLGACSRSRCSLVRAQSPLLPEISDRVVSKPLTPMFLGEQKDPARYGLRHLSPSVPRLRAGPSELTKDMRHATFDAERSLLGNLWPSALRNAVYS